MPRATSPPLVVAYAIAGSLNVNITEDPLGEDQDGNPVYLKDIWPSNQEIQEFIQKNVTRDLFEKKYAEVFKGDENWQAVQVPEGETYAWDDKSTYVQNPPYFRGMSKDPGTISDIEGARILALLGDMVTTDHISPAGSIKEDSPAGEYLISHQVAIAMGRLTCREVGKSRPSDCSFSVWLDVERHQCASRQQASHALAQRA